jgi:hypothetical protein
VVCLNTPRQSAIGEVAGFESSQRACVAECRTPSSCGHSCNRYGNSACGVPHSRQSCRTVSSVRCRFCGDGLCASMDSRRGVCFQQSTSSYCGTTVHTTVQCKETGGNRRGKQGETVETVYRTVLFVATYLCCARVSLQKAHGTPPSGGWGQVRELSGAFTSRT